MPWGDNFTIHFNYTQTSNGAGIANTVFTINWNDAYTLTEIGGGSYVLSCANTISAVNQLNSLQISVNNADYQVNNLIISVKTISRATILTVFLNGQNASVSNSLTGPILSTVNITAIYIDTETGNLISGEQYALSGISNSAFSLTNNQYNINSTTLGLGIYFVTFIAERANYTQISQLIQIDVRQIETNITTLDNEQSYTISPGSDFVPWHFNQ